MKVTADAQVFRDRLAAVAAVVVTRSPREVLRCVRVDALPDGRLRLSATDLRVFVSLDLEHAQVDEPGTVLVDAARLRAVGAVLAGNHVHLEGDRFELRIRCGGCSWTLPGGGDPYDWPEPPSLERPAGSCRIEAVRLQALVDGVVVAASRDEGLKFAIDCVRLRIGGNDLEAAASDGKRAARYAVACHEGAGSVVAVVPARSALMIRKAVVGTCTVAAGDGRLRVEWSGGSAVALLSANFVPLDELMEQTRRVAVTARAFGDATELAAAVRCAAAVGTRGKDDDFSGDVVSVEWADGGAQARMRVPHAQSTSQAPLPLRVDYDEPLSVLLRASYVIEALGAFEGEIEIEARGDEMPLWFAGNQGRLVHLVMPLRKD